MPAESPLKESDRVSGDHCVSGNRCNQWASYGGGVFTSRPCAARSRPCAAKSRPWAPMSRPCAPRLRRCAEKSRSYATRPRSCSERSRPGEISWRPCEPRWRPYAQRSRHCPPRRRPCAPKPPLVDYGRAHRCRIAKSRVWGSDIGVEMQKHVFKPMSGPKRREGGGGE